jgi:pyruvate,water dikinase
MREHGHRSRGELEVANARWSERPDYVLEVVRDYVRAGDEKDALAEHARRGRKAERLARESKRRLVNPFKRAVFSWSLGQARLGAVARELMKSEGVRRMAAIRLFLLELGRRMVDKGLLAEVEDVFFLQWDEWESVLAMLAPFDTDIVVGKRRDRYERDRELTPPPVVIGEWDPEATPSLRLGADATRLAGIGVSPGVARGRARVISSVEAHEKVLPGEILVAPFTDPGWTPYFLPAAGIVMDMGGLLSHGSIIAREYGIPAVVNVGPATSIIKTGDEIEVDGDIGEVRLA